MLDRIEPYFDHSELGPQQVSGEVLNDEEFLAMPRHIRVQGDYLVVSDMASDQSIHVMARGNGERVASFGRRGDGPGEFTTSAVLSGVPGVEDVMYAFDPSKSHVTRLGLPNGEIRELEGRTFLRLPTAGFTYDLEMMNESRAVGLGLFDGGRLGVFDLVSGETQYVGPMPPGDDVRFHILQQAYMGTLVTSPSRHRIAVLSRRASRIEIYDGAGDLLEVFDGPHVFDADYRVDRQGQYMAGLLNRHGYSSAAATDDYIFAAFSGRAEAHFRGWSGSHAEFVHVFTWDGELDRVLVLDREVLAIAVDPSGSTLYALTDFPEPALLRFPLASAHGSPVEGDGVHGLMNGEAGGQG